MLVPVSFQSCDGAQVKLRPGDLFRYFPENKTFGLERAAYPLFAVLMDNPEPVRTWTDWPYAPQVADEYAGEVVDAIVRQHDCGLKPVPHEQRQNEWVLVLN